MIRMIMMIMTTMTSALFLYWRTKRVQWALRCTNTINFLSLSFATTIITTMMIMIQMDPPSWWHQNQCLNQYWIEIWWNLWMHLFYDANDDTSQLQGVKRYLQNSPDKPWPVKAFKGQMVSLTFSFECFRLKQCYARPFPVSVASSSSGVNCYH